MSPLTLVQPNGHKPSHGPLSPAIPQPRASTQKHWLQQPTRQFFVNVNWDGHPPAVQQVRQANQQAIAQGSTEPLSLTLSVSQFFGAVNWDGGAIAPTLGSPPATDNASSTTFTLEDFSDLF